MKKVVKSEKGSVSIFLIIIFTAIFFFNAVLIDYARIMLAKKETENAVRTAVRSVLSSFDTDLYRHYGLFGINSNTNELDIFETVLEKNLSKSPGYFNFVESELDKGLLLLNLDRQLANHTVFEQQIMEEMKYKAPIDLTIDVLDNFTKLSEAMREAARTTETLIDIKNQYEKRNKNLEQVFKYQEKSADLVRDRKFQNFNDLLNVVEEYKNYASNHKKLDELKKEDGATANNSDEDDDNKQEDDNKEEIEKLQRKVSSYKNSANNLIKDIFKDYDSALDKHRANLAKAEDNLKAAKEANEEIKKIIEKSKNQNVNDSYSRVTRENNNNSNTSYDTVEVLREITKNLDENEDLVIDDSFFNSFEEELKEQKQLYTDLVNSLERLKTEIDSLVNKNIASTSSRSEQISNSLQTKIKNIQDKLEIYQEYYLNDNSKIKKRKSEVEVMNQGLDEDQKKDKEKTSKSSLETINTLFKTFEEIKMNNDDYVKLEEYYNQYLEFNSQDKKYSNLELNNNPEDITENAMKNMDKLFLSIADILEEVRNEIYVNEYAFNRFKHFDPTSLKNIYTISKDKDGEGYNDLNVMKDELIKLLDIKNQEVEYILYGAHTPGENLSKAFRDIFLIRVAINTLEGFLDKKVRALGHPIAILVGAITYGITQSIEDMVSLINGEDVPIFSGYIDYPFYYKDYLRLLLFVKNYNENRLARIQALIQFKTKKDLKVIPTYVKGRATTSIDLWFVPGIMKALNKTGIIDGHIDGKRYVITRTAVLSY